MLGIVLVNLKVNDVAPIELVLLYLISVHGSLLVESNKCPPWVSASVQAVPLWTWTPHPFWAVQSVPFWLESANEGSKPNAMPAPVIDDAALTVTDPTTLCGDKAKIGACTTPVVT